MADNKSVLFVCLGNICRSPAAEGICRKIAPSLMCDSAGTGPWHVGEAPDDRSQKVCRKHSIDISSHQGRQVTKQDWKKFSVIAALDPQIFNSLQSSKPSEAKASLVLFNDPSGIDDPYYGSQSGFDSMYDKIESIMPVFLRENKLIE